MTSFDRYVVVDWSARATPASGPDSIWIADLGAEGEPTLTNPPTRRAAIDQLVDVIDDGLRVLIGVDAALGYPAGTAALFGLDGEPWRATWRQIAELVTDDDHNRNDRFAAAATLNARTDGEGPFWGAPTDDFEPSLRRTKPPSFPVAEFRTVEQVLRRAGRSPKSCWQLLGAGSVGGQTLTLLPWLAGLLDRAEVWPLSTGLGLPEARAVIAEVWPSMFVPDAPAGIVRDAAQVAGTAAALRRADRAAELGRWFAPSTDSSAAVVAEEGWILGVVDGDLER